MDCGYTLDSPDTEQARRDLDALIVVSSREGWREAVAGAHDQHGTDRGRVRLAVDSCFGGA